MSTPERLSAALADRYRIERELGAGGMATVYLAADLKHDRKVALKVLKPELAAVLGADRFVVEIKTTASLQHPHILPLFDSGTADGFLYYVMPFIQGEALRDKLNRETQLGVDEAVKIAIDVADALQYAHTQGVIHRDIKPENILIQNGRPMVADFGIALAVSAAAGGRMTETGLSLGTPHYMSPEQATAEKDISARSDMYSLGSVLYEMLTGQPPHVGGSAQQIIMKIITAPAEPVTVHRKSVPPNVAAAVARSLEKLPADRFDSARAFADALGNTAFTAAGSTGTTALALGAVPARSRALHWALGAGVGALATAAVFFLLRPEAPAPDVVRFAMITPDDARLDVQGDEDAPFAISADGKRIVFATRDSLGRLSLLHTREIGQLTSTPLTGTSGAQTPFFSPDGLWVAFTTDDDALKKVPISGGPPITLAKDVQGGVAGGGWGDDGYIVYSSVGYRTSRISGAGGASVLLSAPDSITRSLLWPFVLPGSKAVLFERCSANCAETDLVLFDMTTKVVKVLVPGATRGWYLPGGQLVYATREGAIFAVQFDVERGEIRGAAAPVLDGVRGTNAFGFRLAVSASGAMIYRQGTQATGRQIVEVDRAGRETVVYPQFADFLTPRWSPTRDRVAVVKREAGVEQVWIYDVTSQTFSQLTTEGRNVRPSWSPDGSRVAFYSIRGDSADLYWMPSDRSAPGERVADGEDTGEPSSTFWTRDAAWIVVDGGAGPQNIYAIGTGDDRKRKTAVATPAHEEAGVVSPDGKWIAYVSNEGGGINQIYVRPFMREGGRWLVSTNSAVNALWASNTELIYRDIERRMVTSAKLEMGSTVRVVARTELFSDLPYSVVGSTVADHDISWDGQHFLMLRRPPEIGEGSSPIVVLNWAEEVKRRMVEQGGRAP
jgi:serine/threonine-protein kinase